MRLRWWNYLLISVLVFGILFRAVISMAFREGQAEIVCPKCGSRLVWTPIGTRSENFLWRCLECGESWIKTYPDAVYMRWKRGMPGMVRDMVLKYIGEHHRDTARFIPKEAEWNEHKIIALDESVYEYSYGGWIVRIEWSVANGPTLKVTADYSAQRVSGYVGIPHRIIWEGKFADGSIVEEKYIHAV